MKRNIYLVWIHCRSLLGINTFMISLSEETYSERSCDDGYLGTRRLLRPQVKVNYMQFSAANDCVQR